MPERPLRVVVLVPPLLLGHDFIDYPWFANLGALHTAGLLRDLGHDVTLLDALSTYGAGVYPFERGVRLWGVPVPRLLAPLDRALARGDHPPEVVVVHHSPFLYPEQPSSLFAAVLRAVRERLPASCVILDDGYLGTMHYLDHDRAALLARHDELDYVCQYETDHVLPELLERIAAGNAPPRESPAVARVFRQERAVALDEQSPPAWELVDAASYSHFLKEAFDHSRRPNPFRIAPDTRPLVTSRGCAYDCTFCSANPYLRRSPNPLETSGGPRFRAVPLDVLRHELRELRRTQGAHHVAVLDQVANLRRDFTGLLDLLAEEEFVYDFPNGLRADHLSEDHLARLKGKIGTLSISAESGSQEVLDRIVKKGLRLEEIERVARSAAALGIPVVVHFMVGLPEEGRRDVLATLEFARSLQERYGAEPLVSFATPMPGTKLYARCRELGLEERAEARDPTLLVQHAAALDNSEFTAGELKTALRVFRRHMRAAGPKKLIVNMTYRCNNHCSFCAVGNPECASAIVADPGPRGAEGDSPRAIQVGLEPVARRDAAPAAIRRALNEARADGATLLDLDGGEPLLHPHLVPLIRYARRLQFERITVTTNGRLLTYDETVCTLMASGLHALLISLHGADARVHEALTNAPGSYAETLTGLKNSLRLMGPGFGLGVNTTVTRTNLGQLMTMGEQLSRWAVPQWNLQLVTPFGRAGADAVPGEEALRAALPPLLERYGRRLRMAVVNAPPCLLPGLEHFVAADLGKIDRRMVFVTNDEVNLADYLSKCRAHTARCRVCLCRPVCAGEYRFRGG